MAFQQILNNSSTLIRRKGHQIENKTGIIDIRKGDGFVIDSAVIVGVSNGLSPSSIATWLTLPIL